MHQKPNRVEIDISWGALFKILAIMAGIWALFYLRDILLMVFAVFIFVAAVNPTIAKLQRSVSRPLAVGLFYVALVVGVVVLSSAFIPLLVDQFRDLVDALPVILERSQLFAESPQYSGIARRAVANVQENIDQISRNLVSTTFGFFGGMATLLTGVVMSFYLLLEEKNAKEFFHQVLPQTRFQAVYQTVNKISDRMGSWVRGQVTLMVIIGFINLVVYLVLGLRTPLPLAIWSGLTEAIPYIGPILGLIPAVIVALTTGSWVQAVLVVIAFAVVQQLEAQVIVPKVMGKAVGLSPVLVIIAVLIGLKLFGILGAIIAIPTAAIISVIVGEWSNLRLIWDGPEQGVE